tara:strand:+ start:61 stop:960 length:900 start_codon:yes stop_codon:yes gene_type:complete
MIKLLLKNPKYNFHIYINFFEDYKLNKDKYPIELNFDYTIFKRKYKYYFNKRYYPWNKLLFSNFSQNIDFVPETINYQIDKSLIKNKDLWFIKPYNSSCGKGIIVTNKIYKYYNKYKIQDNMVFQKSVNNLLLYNFKKQDIRIYLLYHKINNKMNIYLYRDGLNRFSYLDYTNNELSYQCQLTNTSVYQGNIEDSCLLFSSNPNYILLYNKIKSNIIKLTQTFLISKKLSNNTFHLFGLDFVPDQNYQTWLIEINDNPMGILKSQNNIITNMKRKMIVDLFNITVFNKINESNLFENIN